MVLAIADQDVTVRHDRHALKPLELGVAGAPRAKSAQEATVRMEDLNAIVARICNTDEALVVDGHTAVEER